MSEKNLFIENRFGRLSYHNVYSVYDIPLIFSAKNEYGQNYFCYFLGYESTNNTEKWLIIPTSESIINKLEQKDISIRKILMPNENSLGILTLVDCETLDVISEDKIKIKTIEDSLPENDIFISENINYDESRDYTHRIRIAVKEKANQTVMVINNISELFSDLLRSSIRAISDITTEFILRDAVKGSYVQRVQTKLSSKNVEKDKLYQLFNESLLKLSNKDDVLELLDNNTIDLKLARELIDKLYHYKANIQVIDENTTEIVLNLKYNLANQLLPVLDKKLENYLDSSMVPQANSLDLVKMYVDALKKNSVVTTDDLNGLTTSRQVLYYKDACRILNLVKDGYLTPQGLRVAELNTRSEWLAIIKTEFENSYCGYLWMKSQNVSSITDITDEKSAIQFLKERATGLSENTSERRAKTLINWLREFKRLV